MDPGALRRRDFCLRLTTRVIAGAEASRLITRE
jgi:hypothetical protein